MMVTVLTSLTMVLLYHVLIEGFMEENSAAMLIEKSVYEKIANITIAHSDVDGYIHRPRTALIRAFSEVLAEEIEALRRDLQPREHRKRGDPYNCGADGFAAQSRKHSKEAGW